MEEKEKSNSFNGKSLNIAQHLPLDEYDLMSSEERKKAAEFMEQFKPKIDIKFGTPLIFGTAGSIEENKDFETLFTSP